MQKLDRYQTMQAVEVHLMDALTALENLAEQTAVSPDAILVNALFDARNRVGDILDAYDPEVLA